jgi:gas vesicle protein
MVGVFGIKHTQIFRCREYALGVGNVGMPPSPSPSVYEAWDEEDRKHAIEAAKQLPQDQFWRAYAGPWSNLDRCSVEGKRGLVFLGACVGGLVGGCFSLLIASIRPSRRRREWYDSLPLTGTCFGALLVNGMLRLAPAPWDYQHRPPRNDFEEITTMIVMGAFIGAVAGYSGRFVFGWKTRREELKGKKTAFLEDAGQMKK